MKFEEYFKEVQLFTAGIYVVSGYLDKFVARTMIEKEYGRSIAHHKIKQDYVRFGFPPDYVEDCDPKEGAVWYTGATGKGKKPVWVFRKYEK